MNSKNGSLRARFKDPARQVELIATILMSIAVVATAYCAYEATRWGGVQATSFAEASSLRVESSKALTLATQQTVYDATSLVQFLAIYSGGATETALDFGERFTREEFKPYLDEWIATKPFTDSSAPPTPFQLESYSNAESDRVDELEAQASAKFDEARAANQTGDDYILATVFFAMVLFFSGIAPKLDQKALQWFILVLAATALGGGFLRALTLPFK